MRDPIVYKHDIGPLEAMGMAGMLAHGLLDAKLRRHIEDDVRHITPDERKVWNNTVELTKSYPEFKNTVTDKISEVVSLIKKIKNNIMDFTGFDVDGDKFMTQANILTFLAENGYIRVEDIVGENASPESIKNYIKDTAREEVTEQLNRYAYVQTDGNGDPVGIVINNIVNPEG